MAVFPACGKWHAEEDNESCMGVETTVSFRRAPSSVREHGYGHRVFRTRVCSGTKQLCDSATAAVFCRQHQSSPSILSMVRNIKQSESVECASHARAAALPAPAPRALKEDEQSKQHTRTSLTAAFTLAFPSIN